MSILENLVRLYLSGNGSFSSIDILQIDVTSNFYTRNGLLDIFESIWFYVFLIVVIITIVNNYRFYRRCSACKKWNVMRVIKKEKSNGQPDTITKSDIIIDVYGQKHEKQYHVPATIYYTKICRKCINCGHTDVIEKSKEVEK